MSEQTAVDLEVRGYEDALAGLEVSGPVWRGVMATIEDLDADVLGALRNGGLEDGERAHLCGRHDGLASVREVLVAMREEGLKRARRCAQQD